ncbi:MAG: thermonuclease family protein [Candidatus Omnitrophica bacterium]|nr:thermonuclease family protein [Candidatus Omnitrophota bacterium]
MPSKPKQSLVKSPNISSYSSLLAQVREEFASLEFFVKSRTVQGYWQVGKFIHQHLLHHEDRADYGQHLFARLGKDIDKDESTLRKIVKFYRTYPIQAARPELTWGHFKTLLAVKDKNERVRLEKEIVQKNLDTRQFQEYLNTKKKLTSSDENIPIPQLKFTRGKPYTYQIAQATAPLVKQHPLALDVGFRLQDTIPANKLKLKEQDLVGLVVQDGKISGVEKSAMTKDEMFTYVAFVQKVVDGDTLLVALDFKSTFSISQKLRLRGIDCPEINTPEGQKAKRFVEARLKNVDFIIVKTYKDRTDRFDRYLADIFYLAGEADENTVAGEGTYLNQQLLDERLAVVYE